MCNNSFQGTGFQTTEDMDPSIMGNDGVSPTIALAYFAKVNALTKFLDCGIRKRGPDGAWLACCIEDKDLRIWEDQRGWGSKGRVVECMEPHSMKPESYGSTLLEFSGRSCHASGE